MILENENVTEALVILQVQHAVPVAPQHVFDGTFGKGGECCKMVWRLNHDFVCADSVHLVKETFSFTVQIALDAQSREFVWHNANAPAWRVWASAVASVNEDFGRSAGFI